MKSANSEVLVALTHFVRGAARLSFTGKRNRDVDLPHNQLDETRRRTQVLQELYRVYSVEICDEQGISVYRETLPPDAWINDRLLAGGERWRVQNVDGFRCEIFDINA